MSNTIETTVGPFEPELVNYRAWPELVKRAFIVAISQDGVQGQSFFRPPGEDEVLLVINGKQFSFEAFVRRHDECLDEEIAKAARKHVEEKVKLSTVVRHVYRLNHIINRELDEHFPLAKRDEDGY